MVCLKRRVLPAASAAALAYFCCLSLASAQVPLGRGHGQSCVDSGECAVENCSAECCPNCGKCHGANGQCEEPHWWSEEWFAMRADRPVGARQVCKHGKLWPPYPRPTGPKQHWVHKFHAAHYWPYPYVCEDRAYVNMITDMQVANGWMTNNTLYDYHFNADTNDLTPSGKLHLQRILEDSPDCHRTVWVQKSIAPGVTEQRLAAAQAASIEIAGAENVAPIQARIATPLSRPADEILIIRQAELSTMPEPRIFYTPVPTGTSGGN